MEASLSKTLLKYIHGNDMHNAVLHYLKGHNLLQKALAQKSLLVIYKLDLEIES